VPIPEFIVELRRAIGHAPLWLAGITAVTIQDRKVLLVKRSDNGAWTAVTGILEPGENPADGAAREVREETGITAELIAKLGDSKYVYVRSWGDRQKVFKIVSFYLLRYKSGRIDDVTPAMRIEVARARWIPLQDAPKLLAYGGEKEMARLALAYLAEHPDLTPPAHRLPPPAGSSRKAPRR